MRRRQLKGLWKRLKDLQGKELKRDDLMLKLGAAKNLYPTAWRLVSMEIPEGQNKEGVKTWSFLLRKDKLRQTRQREGRYLLRTNLTAEDPAKLWKCYIQLTEVEAAFKDLKDDLSLRPVFHQLEKRIEAHVFVAFQAYCLQVSLRQRLRAHAPGLTPRAVLEKFAAIQMLDVHFPTTDRRTLIFRRYTQPEKDHQMILAQLKWELPPQAPPRITAQKKMLNDFAP